ncbi:hypothetical protein [Marinagarivorans algicola]|uniref:hypothetical protein n=1 Tax=Marinagarivorans algicola TaxID=1513270 RepID=UPI003734F8F3
MDIKRQSPSNQESTSPSLHDIDERKDSRKNNQDDLLADGIEEAIKKIIASFKLSNTVISLAIAEVTIAFKSIPKFVALWVLIIQMTLIFWLSIIILCAWFAYVLSGSILVGLITAFFVQILGLFFCLHAKKRILLIFKLPKTLGVINEAFK